MFFFMTNVKASNNCGIVIDYYDDEGKIVNASFRVFKIGEIVNEYENNEYSGLKIISLIDGLNIDDKVKIEDVLAYFDYEEISESKITINNDELISYHEITNEDGKAYFNDLDRGVYLIIEDEASDDHIRSLPAIISLPYTFDNISYDHKVLEPKSILAGDIKITKKLYGYDVDSNQLWNIKINLPEGKYAYSISNGTTGYIQNGDVLAIKANEVISINNVIANYEYHIEELEANMNGYRTFYDNQEAIIKAKSINNSVIYNERYKIPDTKDKQDNTNYYGIILIFVLIMLIFKKVMHNENS